MAKKALTDRQKTVLSWINDGCPDNNWEPSYYKASARKLAGHDLVKIKGRGSTWTAVITERGKKILAGSEPLLRQPAKKTPAPADATPQPLRKESPPTSMPVHKSTEMRSLAGDLFQELLGAEFHVVAGLPINRDNLEVDWESVVTHLRGRNDLLGSRWRVSSRQRRSPNLGYSKPEDLLDVALAPVDYWQSTPVDEVVTAEKISRYHPAVKQVMDYCTNISPAKKPQARRFLHSLFSEVKARGWQPGDVDVSYKTPRTARQRGSLSTKGTGYGFSVDEKRFFVSVTELVDKVERPPTTQELKHHEDWLRWSPNRRLGKFYDRPYNGLLVMTVGGYEAKDTPTGKQTVASSLPRVFSSIALEHVWSGFDAENRRREQLLWEKKLEIARARADVVYRTDVLHKVLVQRAEEWDTYRKVTQYVTDLETYARTHELSSSGGQWLEWCRAHGKDRHPFHQLTMPHVPPQYSYEKENLATRISRGITDEEVS